MTQIFRDSFDTPARPRRRATEELAHREAQRRAARGIGPATVTEPTLHERGNPVAHFPSVWAAPSWIYPQVVSTCNCDRVEGNHDGRVCNGLIEMPAAVEPGDLLFVTIAYDDLSTITIVDHVTGREDVYPIRVAPIEENREYLWVPVGGRQYGHGQHGQYVPFGGEFDYFGNDPAQWEHGEDGGTPMTVAELLGADEKMDEIDRLLEE